MLSRLKSEVGVASKMYFIKKLDDGTKLKKADYVSESVFIVLLMLKFSVLRFYEMCQLNWMRIHPIGMRVKMFIENVVVS